MKTRVGEYKGKVIVEGGENPKNELKPYEMLYPAPLPPLFRYYKSTVEEVKACMFYEAYTFMSSSNVDIHLVIPDSPITGLIDKQFRPLSKYAILAGTKNGYMFIIYYDMDCIPNDLHNSRVMVRIYHSVNDLPSSATPVVATYKSFIDVNILKIPE